MYLKVSVDVSDVSDKRDRAGRTVFYDCRGLSIRVCVDPGCDVMYICGKKRTSGSMGLIYPWPLARLAVPPTLTRYQRSYRPSRASRSPSLPAVAAADEVILKPSYSLEP